MKGLSQPVILVIDTDSLSLATTTALLSGQGIITHSATDRVSALALADKLNLDLVICDVNLNGDDGVDVCLALRKQVHCHDVPVMFLSVSQLPSVASRMFDNGAALFLKKPFVPAILIDLVEKALWMPHLIKSHIHRPHIPLHATQDRDVRGAAAEVVY